MEKTPEPLLRRGRPHLAMCGDAAHVRGTASHARRWALQVSRPVSRRCFLTLRPSSRLVRVGMLASWNGDRLSPLTSADRAEVAA